MALQLEYVHHKDFGDLPCDRVRPNNNFGRHTLQATLATITRNARKLCALSVVSQRADAISGQDTPIHIIIYVECDLNL